MTGFDSLLLNSPSHHLVSLALPAFFLDIDGTLAPIERRPDDVQVSQSLITLLYRLTAAVDGALAILSGRSIDQIDALLSPLLLPAAGLHGSDLRLPSGQRVKFEPAPCIHNQVKIGVDTLTLPQGVWLEEKSGITFALHYREAPEASEQLYKAAAKIAARTGGSYAVQRGKSIVELKPAEYTKGRALRQLMKIKPFISRTPIVLGDDLTDETAFAESQFWNGVAIVVGDRKPTYAGFRLESPAAVHDWLASFTSKLESSGPRGRAATRRIP